MSLLLVYPAENQQGLCNLAERIVSQCAQPLVDELGNEFLLSVSVGVVLGQNNLSATQILHLAGAAMYEVKRSGGNAYKFTLDV